MEAENNKYSLKNLNDLAYRNLQHIAKTMGLPSNVKKAYLIKLIHAKEFKSQEDLNDIIYCVRLERKQKPAHKRGRQSKKNYIQTSEVSSTCNKSPPITETPSRLSALMISHTPKTQQSLLKYDNVKSQKQYTKNLKTYSAKVTPSASDRVLRSSRDRPNYRAMNMSNIFDVTKDDLTPGKVNKVSQESNHPLYNVITVDNPSTSMALDTPGTSKIGPVSTNKIRPMNKRARKISGISPLVTPERSHTYNRTMSFTHQNGKMTRLKALVEKPVALINRNVSDTSNSRFDNRHRSNVMVRLFRESEVTNRSDTQTLQVSNHQGNKERDAYKVDLIIETSRNLAKDNSSDPHNGYNRLGGKIMSTQLQHNDNGGGLLSSLDNNTSSNMNDEANRGLMNPIYVEVCENAETTQTSQVYTASESTANTSAMLESLYNFKTQYIANTETFQHISTTSNTKCVYSTPIITTAIQQTTVSDTNEYNACELLIQNNQCDSALYELLPFAAQDTSPRNVFICNEVLNSTTSVETMNIQDITASASIPQMVEDALDLICQDRDYMERMCMQCFFCAWAGPKFLLENHLRQDHMSNIETYESDEWVTTYTLGGLVEREVWVCRVVQYESLLYVLSAKYEDPDIFMASVNTLTSGVEVIKKLVNITAFNKVTGEPFAWEGPVDELPHTMPYYKETDCFKLELSKMNLLPNSANLQLINRELVVDSPMKVVVGQPALHDIHINLFIKMSDVISL